MKKLTLLEKKIVEMIAQELPNKTIAQKLNYSQRMIEYKINKLAKRFNVQTRVGIVVKAYKYKLIKI